jgi:hypothetical protein
MVGRWKDSHCYHCIFGSQLLRLFQQQRCNNSTEKRNSKYSAIQLQPTPLYNPQFLESFLVVDTICCVKDKLNDIWYYQTRLTVLRRWYDAIINYKQTKSHRIIGLDKQIKSSQKPKNDQYTGHVSRQKTALERQIL